MEDDSDNSIKMIVLGDCGVGKTNIISRYLKNEFKEGQISTSGANYAMKNLEIEGKVYQINIWDTAGQEKYRSVTKMFIQDSQILLLCYSIIEKQTFQNLEYWYKMATDILGNNIVLGVAGNKSDLYEQEEVHENEGENFAKAHNAIFKLISAKANKEGIDILFEELFKKYIKMKYSINNDQRDSIKILQNNNNKKKGKKKCC